MSWEDRRARMLQAVHRAFTLRGTYEDGGAAIPVLINMRRFPATVGDDNEVEVVDDIIEIDMLVAQVASPIRNGTITIGDEMYRIDRIVRRTNVVVTVEVS